MSADTADQLAKLVHVGSKAAAGLPPESSPAAMRRAIKAAMREAAGVKKRPSPKEADRLARETGRMVWGSDNRWHDGTPPASADQEAEQRRFNQFVVAVHQLETLEIEPRRIAALTASWDVPNWLGRLPAVADYLEAVLAALRSSQNEPRVAMQPAGGASNLSSASVVVPEHRAEPDV